MFKKQSKESITLNNQTVAFTLKRSFRKTVTLRINETGLIVNAPFIVSRNYIYALVMKKKEWVLSKLTLFNTQDNNSVIKNEGSIKILNQPYQFSISQGKDNVSLEENICHITTKNINDSQHIKKLFIKWLKNYALNYFEQEVKHLAKHHGFKFKEVKVSSAKTRWGTCNGKGTIRLNWRLILSSTEVINYVICHELCHLSHMNHSHKFWSLVAQICPDYKIVSNELKKQGFSLYRFG